MAVLEVLETRVIIIGAGASGLLAAIGIKLKNPRVEVFIIEKNDLVGRKLRATGNGRCNLANLNPIADMPYSWDYIKQIFKELGIYTRPDDRGLIFPYNESAASFADYLSELALRLGVIIKTNEAVNDIEHGDGFLIHTTKAIYKSQYLVIASGGKAAPMYGTTGDGYAWLKGLGHRINKLYPTLVPIECREFIDKASPYRELSGTRAKASVSLFDIYAGASNKPIYQEFGEIQFREYGLSGICIMNLSQYLKVNTQEQIPDRYRISIDLIKGLDDLALSTNQDALLNLRTVIKPSLINLIYHLASGDNDRILSLLHRLDFTPLRTRGWQEAQVTAGGLDLQEIDNSCRSKLIPNLYIIGEILDYQGPCGGYNLMHAFGSGYLAGCDIVNRISNV